jgi:hypothetical protein
LIKVDNIEVFNFEGALHGMRNPLESWEQSDSKWVDDLLIELPVFKVGDKDLALALKLIKAGTDHSKFLRQIFVSMDITAPMTWWVDFDTYKVSTVRNSTSRMHKLGTRLLTVDDFSWDNEDGEVVVTKLRQYVLDDLNERILKFQELKKTDLKLAMKLWRDIVLDLPDSYNFFSTWTGNYQNLRNIYHARKDHKQREFRDFCKIIETLPYSELITIERR